MGQAVAFEKVASERIVCGSKLRSSLRNDLLFNVGSQTLLRVVTAVTALYAARVLGPSSFGLWALLQVIFMYTAQGHFGTVNAMLREVPTALTRADDNRANNVTNATWMFVSICSIPMSLSAAAVVLWVLRPASPSGFVIAAATAWLVIVQLQSVFFQFYCRGYGKFRLLAALSTAQAILILPLCLYWIPKYGIAGYLFALSSGFTLIAIAAVVRPSFGWRVAGTELRNLLVIGLPMLPGGLMLYLNMSVERVALSVLGTTAVGVFVAGAFFFQIGGTIWELIVYTWYGRLAALYARTERISSLVNAFREIIPGALWVTSIFQGAGYILLPAVLRQLLPEYASSVPICQILVFTVNLWGIAQFFGICMGIVAHQKRAVLVQALFLIVKLASVCVVVAYFRRIEAVAFASAGSVVVYLLLIFAEWARISGSVIGSIWKWALFWSIPTGLAILCLFVGGPDRTVVVFALYIVSVGTASLALSRKSLVFRELYAWGAAR